jgi:hypothetical protein
VIRTYNLSLKNATPSHLLYCLNVHKRGSRPASLGRGGASIKLSQCGQARVAGESVTGGRNGFSSQSMDVGAAVEPVVRLSAQLER